MRRAVGISKPRHCSSSMSYSTHCRSDPYEFLLHALREVPKSLRPLRQVHALVVANGLLSKSVLACRLIGHYGRLSGPDDARRVFEYLPKRTSHAYNYMLRAYVDSERYMPVLELYSRILSTAEAFPDAMSLSLVVKACVALRLVRVGKLIHGHVLVTGSDSDLYLMAEMINFYSKCGHVDDAKKLFDFMPHRDVVIWTTMIDGYFRDGCFTEGLGLFERMRRLGLKAYAATWNAVISGFARDELVNDALYQFRLMQMDGVRPDEVNLCTILPLFCQNAILKSGLEAHAYAIRNGFESYLFVANALVDMYAKCGNLISARCLFDRVLLKDIGLWNAIILGYGMHGDCKEVLQLFHQMKISGMMPNKITFTCVLSACSHVGFVSEGIQFFYLMSQKYGITASLEHYACMVDMFGRAGQLDEAFEFIKHMPVAPTKDIWGALLSACRTHHNVELAEIVAQNMFNSKNTEEESGYHVIMSNIYAKDGQWEDVAKMRTQIRDISINKRMGFSWIEVGGTIYTFNRADMSHPQADEICALLRNFEAAILTGLTW